MNTLIVYDWAIRLMKTSLQNTQLTARHDQAYFEVSRLGHIKKFLFPVPARITFGERIKKKYILHLIEFDVFGTTINCFSVKADSFCPLS